MYRNVPERRASVRRDDAEVRSDEDDDDDDDDEASGENAGGACLARWAASGAANVEEARSGGFRMVGCGGVEAIGDDGAAEEGKGVVSGGDRHDGREGDAKSDAVPKSSLNFAT